MKIIFTLSILITFFFASSCSQDDDTQPGVPTAVLGTWEMVGFNDYIELDYATILNSGQMGRIPTAPPFVKSTQTLILGTIGWKGVPFAQVQKAVCLN